MHGDAVAAQFVGAHRGGVASASGIAGRAQLLRDGGGGELLPDAYLARCCIDARRLGEERLLHPLVHHLLVPVGVVAKGDAKDEQRESADNADEDQHRLPEGLFGDAAIGRELYFDWQR